MKNKVIGLVDCNNFFVSCERVFRPNLEGKPVVVLSSNAGCAVARSNEAKALGIPMGAPAFKYRQFFKDNEVAQFSANFELYGDIARRITQVLVQEVPKIEIYSIDESFLDLSEIPARNLDKFAQKIRHRVWSEIGIPVSIGIAPTKTLAKLASELAKKDSGLNGILDISKATSNETDEFKKRLPLQDIWGVGRKFRPKLMALGIKDACGLSKLSYKQARQLMGLRGEQMVRELNGQSCLTFEPAGQLPKTIARTRTFGEDTSEFHVLESAITNFTAQAAFRLRLSGQLAKKAGLFLMTNRHKPGFKAYSSEVKFSVPTADSGYIMSSLIGALSKIYKPAKAYHRAGVWLYDFVSAEQLQTDLLGGVDVKDFDKSADRMRAVDKINSRFGKNTIKFAAEDLAKTWEPQHKLRSPRYVSNWDELPIAKIT